MKKRIKIQGLLIVTGLIVLVLLRRFLFAYARDIRLAVLGVILILCGYFLRIAARGIKSELNTDGKTLLTGGIYGITRNPMYLGTLFIGLGVVLALLRFWVGMVFIAIYLAIYLPQINKETVVLTERFGEVFRKYSLNTPAFFPQPKMFLKIFTLKIKFSWVKKELSSLMGTLIVIFSLMIWVRR